MTPSSEARALSWTMMAWVTWRNLIISAGVTHQARKAVDAWVDLLAEDPTAITDLQFLSRTPKRLAALSGQPQLRRLVVKWGDYEDLSALQSMTELRHLELRGASAVSNLRPLAGLTRLNRLAVEGFAQIDDSSPMASSLTSNWAAGG